MLVLMFLVVCLCLLFVLLCVVLWACCAFLITLKYFRSRSELFACYFLLVNLWFVFPC